VVKSARVMKKAVGHLIPFMEEEKRRNGTEGAGNGTIVMATVKGDVHDIGKNIVGVVLQCNNFEIIDLGVMVPADTILKTAREHNVDLIGLSGLITPSLDEMVHIAKELERLGMRIPLMIGGATTSKAHTAVKIEPNYSAPTVYVHNASRSVGVASALLSDSQRDPFMAELRAEYEEVRERHYSKHREARRVNLEKARANKQPTDWQNYQPPVPTQLGLQVFERYDLRELVAYIDWTFFFHTWELKGRFPQILDHPEMGSEARKLYADARAMLEQLIDGGRLEARAVVGLFPANQVNEDDIEIYPNESRQQPLLRIHQLRQQTEKNAGRYHHCLSDFVAPKDSGVADYVGAFAVTAGIGLDAIVAEYEAQHDDYNSIMVKALADRLAEAFAERMHQRVRTEFWGYAADETLGNEELIKETYRGIRPAPGYPACPDHTEKALMWQLLDAEASTGIGLTDSFAMTPAASVSGWYFSHPESCYFGIAKLGEDQVEDYAKRKGMSLAEMERWLAPNLGYEPEDR